MFERPGTGERAVLVHLATQFDQQDLSELTELSISAGAIPAATVTSSRRFPDPRNFLGKGKLEELKSKIELENAEVVLVNHSLSPSQERNLEKELGLRVIDRNGLILDIFAQRAQSFEGKLQVELAQLRHLSTRLVRGWTHLERQKGGIGFRGPGESQLETDRRLIGKRIKTIQHRLEKVEKLRYQGRNSRKRSAIPTIALVGYTNAGKSTLFNRLTGSNVYAANKLFATLDPTLRRCPLNNGTMVVLADTVGFIRGLPHELVAAFRATLQEATEADVLLHVIDSNAEHRRETIDQVDRVLADIGAGDLPQIEIYNKIDLIEKIPPRVERDQSGKLAKVWVSAKTGAGIALLKQALEETLIRDRVRRRIHLSPSQASLRSKLFDRGTVLKDEDDKLGGWNMEVEVNKKDLGLLLTTEIGREQAEL